ncbi:MAG: hypothetical protein E6Q97_15595 [Desulfurellales bacterium]|nr:MAG: hypothetical protein E6Q97_15595 [Desulfurellales bacterium]
MNKTKKKALAKSVRNALEADLLIMRAKGYHYASALISDYLTKADTETLVRFADLLDAEVERSKARRV